MRLIRKPYRWSSLVAVLALCLLLGLVYGCSLFGKKEKDYFQEENEWIQDMRKRITDSIENPDKKTNMLAIADQVSKDLLELDTVAQKLYADFVMLDDSYYATPEDYQKIISEFEAGYKKVRDRILDRRFKLRDLSTPEEWSDLTNPGKRKRIFKEIIKPDWDTTGGSS